MQQGTPDDRKWQKGRSAANLEYLQAFKKLTYNNSNLGCIKKQKQKTPCIRDEINLTNIREDVFYTCILYGESIS